MEINTKYKPGDIIERTGNYTFVAYVDALVLDGQEWYYRVKILYWDFAWNEDYKEGYHYYNIHSLENNTKLTENKAWKILYGRS